MKQALLVVILSSFVCLSALAAPQQTKKQRDALKQELSSIQRWPDRDVAYIITDEERAAWKQLNTDEERESFIEQFWLRRDPTPDTPENEYKEEYYRRIAYANEHYASGIPGWKTDRGRIYIKFGPPDEIDSHPSGGSYQRPPEEGGGQADGYPFETWRYRYIEGIGQDVVLEFVDTTMSGEYRQTINPEEKNALAHVPNNTNNTNFRSSFVGNSGSSKQFDALETFVGTQKAPKVRFGDLEAMVESKITYNLLPFQTRADFIKITSDAVMVALTVQIANKDITFQNRDGIQHAAVNVFGRVSTMTRRVAQTFEEVISVDTPESLLPQTLERKNVYWQALPLRPGRYRLNLVLKDIQSGNVGTFEQSIVVPEFDDETLAASSLILTDKIEKVSTKDIGKGQFVIGSFKVRPSVNDVFRKGDTLGFYVQIYNMKADQSTHKPSAVIDYVLRKAGDPADAKPVFQSSEKAEDIPGAGAGQLTVAKILPLDSLPAGRYTLQMKVTDNVTNKSITPAVSFTVQ